MGVCPGQVGARAWRRSVPRAGRSPGSEEARLLQAGALAGPRFPVRTRRGGWGHRAPSRTKPGASPAQQVVPLGAGAMPVCLMGSLRVAMCAPGAGPQGGPGAGVLGSQPTGAEPGSRNECYLRVAAGGWKSGAARWPEPGSSVGSSVSPCLSRRTAPPRRGAVCRRGSWGLGTSPRGEVLGLPSGGDQEGAVLASLPAPTPLRDSWPLCPRGPHPRLGTKIPLDFSASARGPAGCCCPSVEGRGLREAGGLTPGPAAHGGRGLAPHRALPAPSSPTLPPQAQTP